MACYDISLVMAVVVVVVGDNNNNNNSAHQHKSIMEQSVAWQRDPQVQQHFSYDYEVKLICYCIFMSGTCDSI